MNCRVVYIFIGIILLILRIISMIELWYEVAYPFYEGFFVIKLQLERSGLFHTSNLISIIVCISLLTQLKIKFLNSIIIILYPLIGVICVLDIMSILFLQIPIGVFSLNSLTLHIPTTIVGTLILINHRNKISLNGYIISLGFIFICLTFIDYPRLLYIFFANFALWLIILSIYNILLLKYGII